MLKLCVVRSAIWAVESSNLIPSRNKSTTKQVEQGGGAKKSLPEHSTENLKISFFTTINFHFSASFFCCLLHEKRRELSTQHRPRLRRVELTHDWVSSVSHVFVSDVNFKSSRRSNECGMGKSEHYCNMKEKIDFTEAVLEVVGASEGWKGKVNPLPKKRNSVIKTRKRGFFRSDAGSV